MSSENKQSETHSTEESSIRSIFSEIFYYFDIFYRVFKSLFVLFLVVLVVFASLGAGTAIGYFASLVHGSEIPDYDEMVTQLNDFNLTSTMYYAGGEEISELRSDLNRTPVPLEDISDYLVDALIATEDEYFYDHDGVVPKAVGRALIQQYVADTADQTGGSTLTQQLIKQQMIGDDVTHERKANEILLAMRIENHLEKDEILEAYLNVSPFGRNNKGQNIAGVEEAAQGLFGVPASEVNLAQAAFIAGLPQSPIAYSPYTQYGEMKENLEAGLNRRLNVLFRMYQEGYITEEEYREARDYDVTEDFLHREEQDYEDMSYVYDLAEREARQIILRQLLEEDGVTNEDLDENDDLLQEYYDEADYQLRNGGLHIHTTIDRDIHYALEQTVEEFGHELGIDREGTFEGEDEDGEPYSYTQTLPVQIGGSLIENETGRVIAFVGGRNYDDSQFNNAFDARRQPGSAIKPLTVFGPALEEGMITPATIIPDTEVEVPHWEGGQLTTHTPTNYGRTTNDWLSARHWLATSQNIPAQKIYMELLNNDIDPGEYGRRLGLPENHIQPHEYQYPTSALGGFDHGSTVTNMVSAYGAIANGGEHVDPYVIERIETTQGDMVYEHEQTVTEVWSPQTNWLLLDMLRDVHGSGGTASGMMNQLNFDTDLFSKTGTTNDAADLWYVGSTPNVSFGTWIGYDTNEFGLGDDFGLLPSQRNRNMWARLMNVVHEVNPDIVGANASHGGPPGGVTQMSVLNETGMQPGSVDLPNGGTTNISGSSYSEYFNSSNLPGTTTYDFALGATDEELANFWSGRGGSSSSDDNDAEEDTADDDEEDDEEEEEPEEDEEPEEEPEEDDEEEDPEPDEPEADDPGNGDEDDEEEEDDNGSSDDGDDEEDNEDEDDGDD